MRERGLGPIDGRQDDRNDNCFMPVMTSKGQLHFDVVAVVRREEVRADQQKNDVCRACVCIDLIAPFLSNPNAPVVPGNNEAAAFQER